MRITFLGTGTSVGIPMIGCDCEVCRSTDPRNRRRRSSLWVEAAGQHLVVDTPPDFRDQALEFGLPRVDALFFTHSHADHIFGLDDIRRFNTLQQAGIPAYAGPATLADLRRVFSYIWDPAVPAHLYRPRLDFLELGPEVRAGDVKVTPAPVVHGQAETFGFRFDAGAASLGYAPDCNAMPEDSVQVFRGVDVMVLDALRHRPHRTHLTVADSVELLERIGARRSLLVHMAHDLDHEATQRLLPDRVDVSYDGLTLAW